MSKDPDYARKQSAKQYARIKADPDRLAEHKAKQRERNQMPSYRESLRKSWKKFKEKNKETIKQKSKDFYKQAKEWKKQNDRSK